MNTTFINWALALAMGLLLSCSYMLDGPDDHSTEMAVAASVHDATRQAERDARLAKFMATVCGPNAGYQELPDGTVQCYTHTGRKTVKVAL